MNLTSRLPEVGTSIFTVMSKMALDHGAINLSQGFPDFPVSEELIELIYANMRAGHNQYAPMPGAPALKQSIAKVVLETYNRKTDPDTDIIITAGGTEALYSAIAAFIREGDEVIIEQFVKGTEITCGLFKHKGEFTVLPITEVVSKNEFFDFEAKYTAHMADEITPARIPEETAERVRKIVKAIYDILGCKGIVRIDFILSDNRIFLLEVNTTPGMTATSFIPQQIRAAGIDIKEVFAKVIEEAIEMEK